jgi:hypothetical protein
VPHELRSVSACPHRTSPTEKGPAIWRALFSFLNRGATPASSRQSSSALILSCASLSDAADGCIAHNWAEHAPNYLGSGLVQVSEKYLRRMLGHKSREAFHLAPA